MMDVTSLIGSGQNAFSSGLNSRADEIARKAKDTTAANGLDLKAARTTAESFESLFIGQMLEYMTEGVEVDSEFGGGHAEEMWKSMMNQEYGKHIVKSGGLGIANQVMASMIKAQEVRTTAEQKINALDANAGSSGDDSTAASIATAAQLRR